MARLTAWQHRFPFMQNISLDDTRLLAQVARYGTFLETGQRLGLATTTVSRRVAALEASVGAQLVNRTQSGTVLTEAGKRLVEATQALTMELESRIRGVAGADSQMSGHVKVSVVEGLIPETIAAIQRFRQRHPKVSFSLDGTPRAVDMSKSEADIALRTLKPRSDGLILRSIAPVRYGVYASAEPCVSRIHGSMPTILAHSDAVLLGGELQGLKESIWLRQCTRSVALEVETLAALMDAVRRGIGVGVLPDALAFGDKTLRRLGDGAGIPRKTLWLVMNPGTAKAARVREFARHLTEALRASFAARA